MYGQFTAIRRSLLLLALLGALLMFAGSAQAQEPGMSSLLMPGELIAGHADEEDNCSACHQSFAKEAQDALCVDCHTGIAADIESSTGFHGRSYHAESDCSQCHSDHLGRDADITSLQIDSFDHRQTDFPLRGAHQLVACSNCHEPKETWREAPGQCIDCHREDEPHRAALGEACADCHNDTDWAQPRFDHGTTDFPLLGKHQQTSCAACHPAERYEATPTQCAACHSLNDVHRGQRGQDCALCHDVNDWTDMKFEHNRDTEFELLGAHSEMRCQGCHAVSDMKQVAGNTCIDCHRSDDVHTGRNGVECNTCHGNDKWENISFDHNVDTKYPLRGEHAELSCQSCHFSGTLEYTAAASCSSCHASDDPHRRVEGEQCGSCHRESSWQQVSFDHELSNFPLLGLHANLLCDSCHLDKAYQETGSSCIDCHQQDDIHVGGLGTECAQCHNPTDWPRWDFDHGSQTNFPLTDGHSQLSCQQCHDEGDASKTSGDCYSCHRHDDLHSGNFGRDCSRCHNTAAFSQLEILR
jgi:hypothetical protein